MLPDNHRKILDEDYIYKLLKNAFHVTPDTGEKVNHHTEQGELTIPDNENKFHKQNVYETPSSIAHQQHQVSIKTAQNYDDYLQQNVHPPNQNIVQSIKRQQVQEAPDEMRQYYLRTPPQADEQAYFPVPTKSHTQQPLVSREGRDPQPRTSIYEHNIPKETKEDQRNIAQLNLRPNFPTQAQQHIVHGLNSNKTPYQRTTQNFLPSKQEIYENQDGVTYDKLNGLPMFVNQSPRDLYPNPPQNEQSEQEIPQLNYLQAPLQRSSNTQVPGQTPIQRSINTGAIKVLRVNPDSSLTQVGQN